MAHSVEINRPDHYELMEGTDFCDQCGQEVPYYSLLVDEDSPYRHQCRVVV